MSVHYKFKSALEYDTVLFDGLHISLKDLKSSIIQQKRIGKGTDFDLQVTNAQTKEVYSDDNALIPKNTSLLIARVPLAVQNKSKTWDGYGGESTPPPKLDEGGIMGKTADLAASDAPEGDKIKAMMSQSTLDYDPSNYMKIRGSNQQGPVPPSYKCYKCHQGGHWIKDCTFGKEGSENQEVKKSTGIPRSFMVPVEGPQVPGAMMTPNGSYAVPALDHQAYNAKGVPIAPEPVPPVIVAPEIPEDLICSICHDLLADAVMIPCCGNSFCDECIRDSLVESEENECPDCHEKDISPGTLIPNRFLRKSVSNFKNTTGYIKKPVVKVPAQTIPIQKMEPNKFEAASPKEEFKIEPEEKPVISEADSTEPPKTQKEDPDDIKKISASNGDTSSRSSKGTVNSEGPPGVSPVDSPKNRVVKKLHHDSREDRHRPLSSGESSPRRKSSHSRKSPKYDSGHTSEERQGTPTKDEPGNGFPKHSSYHPPNFNPQNAGSRPPMQMPPHGHMNVGPPPQMYPGQPPMGGFPPPGGPPPNYRLPPPAGAPYPPPGPYNAPPRPMFDPSRPPMGGPPPFGPNYPPPSRPPFGDRGRGRNRTPPGVIDDPLAAFNRMLREKDERRAKQQQMRRSWSRSRSRSRSYSPRSPRRMRSRSPVLRDRRRRSRSRSFTHSRRFKEHLTDRHDYRAETNRERDYNSRERERARPSYDRGYYDNRGGGGRDRRRSPWQDQQGPPPHHQRQDMGGYNPPGGPGGYPPPQEMTYAPNNRFTQRDYPVYLSNMPKMQPMMPKYDDDIAPPGVEQPPIPGLEEEPPKIEKYEKATAPELPKPLDVKSVTPKKSEKHHRERRDKERRRRSRSAEKRSQTPKTKSPEKHRKKKPRDQSEEHPEEQKEDDKSKKSKEKKKRKDKDKEKSKKKDKKDRKDKHKDKERKHKESKEKSSKERSKSEKGEKIERKRSKSPIARNKSPSLQKSPLLDQNSPFLGEKSPYLGEKSPYLGEKSPFLGESPSPTKSPLRTSKSPLRKSSNQKSRSVDRKSPLVEQKSRSVDKKSTSVDSKSRTIKKSHSGRKSSSVDRKSSSVDRNSREVNKKSREVDRKSRPIDKKSPSPRKSRSGSRKSQHSDQESHSPEPKSHDDLNQSPRQKSRSAPLKSPPNDEDMSPQQKSPSNDQKSPYLDEKSPSIDRKSPTSDRNRSPSLERPLTPKAATPSPKVGLYDDVFEPEDLKSAISAHDQSQDKESGELDMSKEFDDEEKDILELHSNELLPEEIKNQIPEVQSKWDLDDDESGELSPQSSDIKMKEGGISKEVLKKAENAIFAKAINAIRPIEIKKISGERAKIYTNERDSNEKDLGDNLQITISSVVEKKDPPPKISVKDRLGIKVDERSQSPFSRRLGERNRSRDRHTSRNERTRTSRRPPNDRRHDRKPSRSQTKPERSKRSRSRSNSNDRNKKRRKDKPKSSSRSRPKVKDEKHPKDAQKDEKPKQVEKRKPTIDEAHFEPDYDLESDSEVTKVKKDETTSSDSSSSSSADDKKRKKHKKHKRKRSARKNSTSSSSSSESDSSSDEKSKRAKKHKKLKKKKKKSKHK